MKKMKVIIVSIVILALATVLLVVSFADEERTGVIIENFELYRTIKELPSLPHTWEAWIRVQKNATPGEGDDGFGIIMGNFNGTDPSVGIGIKSNGLPTFSWSDGTNLNTYEFKNDLRTGEWIFLSMTNSDNELKCYINGELVQTKKVNLSKLGKSQMNVLCLGGDLRTGNRQNLKQSSLSSAAIYSEVRTQEQIKNDMNKIDRSDSTLLGYWDLSLGGSDRLLDLSGNDFNLSYRNTVDPSKNESVNGYILPLEGMSFSPDVTYQSSKVLELFPTTYEATVWIPKNLGSNERPGILFGTYGASKECVSFEVTTNGAPRLYAVNSDGKTYDWVFNQVNLCTSEWQNVAIVRNGKTLQCYVNGSLKQEKSIPEIDLLPNTTFGIGGDLRPGNERAFKGAIKDINIYSTVRTKEQISDDASNPGKDKNGLIVSFSMNQEYGNDKPTEFADLSGNGYDVKDISPKWVSEKEPVKNYAYSFAVIGDTELMTEKHPEGLAAIYDYIVSKVDEKNIKFVFGLGDITSSNVKSQWKKAFEQIEKLDNLVPYSLVRGDNDSLESFRKYVNYDSYIKSLGGTYGNEYENSWRVLEINDVKYLILTLDYGPTDTIISWAEKIIDDHPDYNVIITTHAYLYRDGTTIDSNDLCPPTSNGGANNGDDIWEKLIKKHKNIVMVLCGHDPCQSIVLTKSEGENGNIVSQLLINPEVLDITGDGAGMVAFLYFSEDGKNVQIEYYSTVRKQYLLLNEPTSFNLDTLTDHILTRHKAEKATCVKEGHIEYYSCSCGELFYDADGKKPLKDIADTITPINNNHVDNDGDKICDLCGAPYDGLDKKDAYTKLLVAAGIILVAVIIVIFATKKANKKE